MRKVQNRREFFAAVLRYGLLAGFAAGGVVAGLKRRRLLERGVCINDGLCSGCEVFEKCGLPQALSLKADLNGD